MLAVGSPLPHVTVVDQDLAPVDLAGLVAHGPVLLAFYLYDWTGT
jgi:peroxiredoxin